jgi:hypothetical protein
VNVRALSEFMGHGGVAITLDLYGHCCPAHTTRPLETVPTAAQTAAHPAETAS